MRNNGSSSDGIALIIHNLLIYIEFSLYEGKLAVYKTVKGKISFYKLNIKISSLKIKSFLVDNLAGAHNK